MVNRQKSDIESLEENNPFHKQEALGIIVLVKNKAAQKLGKKGGQTTKKKYGKKYYQKIGRMAAKARWGKPIASVA